MIQCKKDCFSFTCCINYWYCTIAPNAVTSPTRFGGPSTRDTVHVISTIHIGVNVISPWRRTSTWNSSTSVLTFKVNVKVLFFVYFKIQILNEGTNPTNGIAALTSLLCLFHVCIQFKKIVLTPRLRSRSIAVQCAITLFMYKSF